MKDQEAAQHIAEITGALATAIVVVAIQTAKECSSAPSAYMDALIGTFSGLAAQDHSPVQQRLFDQLTRALEDTAAAMR